MAEGVHSVFFSCCSLDHHDNGDDNSDDDDGDDDGGGDGDGGDVTMTIMMMMMMMMMMRIHRHWVSAQIIKVDIRCELVAKLFTTKHLIILSCYHHQNVTMLPFFIIKR